MTLATKTDPIPLVLQSRSPTKIFQSVVIGYIIPMTRFHFVWAWASKRHQNKTVNENVSLGSVEFQIHQQMVGKCERWIKQRLQVEDR